MLGIGQRLDKATKMKIIAQKAKQYNEQYDDLVNKGVDPDEAAKFLQKQQFNRRHDTPTESEPYKNSAMNPLGGTVNLGYTQNHKVKSSTKTMYEPMDTRMKESKMSGTNASIRRNPDQQKQFAKMKERIYKDHLNEDFDIHFGDVAQSDYKRHFKNDQKMKELVETRDCKYNQRKNQLLWYAETYIKTKDSLRKC